jgi:hypothetical protein
VTAVTLLYLTEWERYALAGLVQVDAVRVGDAITHAKDADALEEAIGQAREHLAVMRACERGHLTLDLPIVQRLADHRRELLADMEKRGEPTAGRRPGLTPQQNVIKTRVEIDRLAEEAEAIDSVLRRGGAPETGAAA